MEIEEIQKICSNLPAVTEDIKWENNLCFCVAGKMFLILGLDQDPVPSSMKVSEEDFDDLTEREGFKPAPYMARYKWIWSSDLNNFSRIEWEEYIPKAYNIIRNKLPKKTKLELGFL